MMAKREHAKNLTPILEKCLEESVSYFESKYQKYTERINTEKIKEILNQERKDYLNH